MRKSNLRPSNSNGCNSRTSALTVLSSTIDYSLSHICDVLAGNNAILHTNIQPTRRRGSGYFEHVLPLLRQSNASATCANVRLQDVGARGVKGALELFQLRYQVPRARIEVKLLGEHVAKR